MAKKLYGFYSLAAVRDDCGTSFYSTPDGGEVEVTCVSEDREGKSYLWEDKVCLGEVSGWARRGYIPPEDQQLEKDYDDLAIEHDYDFP